MGKLSREFQMGIHNRFDFEVIDVKTGEVKQKARALNIICNSYYSTIINDGYADNIHVGSGSGTPAATDTALFHYEGAANMNSTYNPQNYIDESQEHNGVWRRIIKQTIPNTELVGITITEVGLATDSSGSTIVTHAMLQDMNGNPISIQHTNTDIINIYCTIFLHYAGQDSDIHLYTAWPYKYYSASNERGFVNRGLLKETEYTSSGRNEATAATLFFGIFGPRTYTEGQNDQNVVFCPATWSSSGRSLTVTASQMEITKGNLAGLGHISFGGFGAYYSTSKVYASIDIGGTTVPSNVVTDEIVGTGDGTTTKFKTKWSYPRNAVVKVNGIVQSAGVTVKRTPAGRSWSGSQNITDAVYNYSPYEQFNMAYHASYVYPQKISMKRYYGGTTYDRQRFRNGYIMEIAHPEIGISDIGGGTATQGSNDGETWVNLSVPRVEADKHYRYYKNNYNGEISVYMNAYDGYNIIFDTAPAQGDIITIDYVSDYIPKDADHVLDVSLTCTYGEWTGE